MTETGFVGRNRHFKVEEMCKKKKKGIQLQFRKRLRKQCWSVVGWREGLCPKCEKYGGGRRVKAWM